MVGSINTNPSAFVALQNLNANGRTVDETQNRISTGNRVTGPKDDAATLAIAQELLGEIGGRTAVQDGLNRADATVGVAQAAAQQASDTLIELKGLAVKASQEGLDDTSRAAIKQEFNAKRDQLAELVGQAEFDGVNLLEADSDDLRVLTSEDGDSFSVAAQDFSLTGLGIDGLSLGTAGDAQSAIGALDGAIARAASGQAALGTAQRQIEEQGDFNSRLRDSLRAGVGNLVDADLGAESANLQASRVKQELGVVAQNIANAAPRFALSLF